MNPIPPCPLCGGPGSIFSAKGSTFGQEGHGCRECKIWMTPEQWSRLPRRVDDAEALLEAFEKAVVNADYVDTAKPYCDAREAVLAALVVRPTTAALVAAAERVVERHASHGWAISEPLAALRDALKAVRK